MNAAIPGVTVVVLFVQDLERSKAFYRDTLGMELKFEDPDSAFVQGEKASLILLTLNGARDLLSNEAVAEPRPAGATSILVAFVDDVHAVHRDLAAKGVEFVREPMDRAWGMRTAHFRDPDGNIWELTQPIDTGQ